MGELELLKYVGSIGGAAGVLALVIFFAYRNLVGTLRTDRKFMEDRLIELIKSYHETCHNDQEIMIKHTQIMTELFTYLKMKNGNH